MPSADRTLPEVDRNTFLHCDMVDRGGDVNTLSVPMVMRRGGSETCLDLDTTDLVGRDTPRSRSGLDSLQQKVLKVKEQLRIEQNLQDENVAEYLKLINSADKQQSSRIKQVFEKKNQKTVHNIAQLQKKLEQYQRKMKEYDVSNGTKLTPPHSKDYSELPKDNLKESMVTGSGRHLHLDKVKTIGPGVSLSPPFFFSKPREIANLIRNKFGSADNIAHLKSSMETGSGLQVEGGSRALSGSATLTSKPKYPSDDECSTETSVSVESNGHVSGSGATGHHSESGKEGGHNDSSSRIAEAWEEIRELREAQNLLAEDVESLKTQFKCEFEHVTQTLQEERYRCERLEDQLNDLTELHQNETANLKQELASIEEKIAYQAYERARDIQDALEVCQTRVSKLELQQQQQQVLQLESADAKVLLGKCINIMLAIVTVILVCVSTAAKFSAPLLRSRLHMFGTFVCVCLLAFGWSNWEHLQCAVERMLLPR
ncbi:transmembrane and coiled-coil domain protein 3 isoform X1 [Myxocyprinus asiaticus]|uniref:transmembrane and coiled-coil domain protein 3 isoform X1 n=1 Tax=Myxocyprinus asiaticus TaxID=70543 RepID=UPI002223642D|nr:transmembrane and coiled-coil domain protein 3 isoform X1 [Myxocyprinus asiaticus]